MAIGGGGKTFKSFGKVAIQASNGLREDWLKKWTKMARIVKIGGQKWSKFSAGDKNCLRESS